MISIILPIRNESNFISKTLDSIINQDYPKGSLEIIIADGMSDDGTLEIIHSYQENNPNIKVVDNPEGFVPTGFNRALSLTSGVIVIRIDGHSAIDADFIKNCMMSLKNTDADCVGGIIKNISKGIFGHLVNIAQSSKFGVGGVAFREDAKEGMYVDTLAFGAYKRQVFEKIGAYDEELIRNQDDEFNFRLIQNGGKIWLDPSINSVYYPRNSLKKLFKQYFQYGFYKVRVMQKRRGFTSWRHLVPGTFVFSLLVSILLLPITHYLFYLIFGSYLTVNLIATFIEFVKSYNSSTHQPFYSFTILPLTFFTLHFSYGSGFLSGLIYFWNKWHDREVKDLHFDKKLFIKNTICNN